jgi:glycosyltransferase involved in cell wall biosynthesis
LRALHVGSGFRPWRRGGLVAYIEDLMAAQRRRGHAPSYFFSGRHYPYIQGPRMRRLERGGISMFEVVNSPLYDHGRQPDLELSEPQIERMFARTVNEVEPDVVHFQELAGLPSSLIDVAGDLGVPTVLTLQDYYLLCPMFKLRDADGRPCLRHAGADCARAVDADPRDPALLVEATIHHDLATTRGVGRIAARAGHARVHRVARALAERSDRNGDHGRGEPAARAAAFQRRRDVNVERLNRIDRLVAMSNRVAEIYTERGVSADRLQVMHLTLDHIDRIRPREARPEGSIVFGTLAGLESEAKGARVLLDAIRLVAGRVDPGRFRVAVFGHLHDDYAETARALPSIDVRGLYAPHDLDAILDEVHVGLMTSVWEEAYGYAGVEFLAKGIPVIANAIGGVVDYARDGETAWLNRSCSAEELASIMVDVIERPEQIATLNANLLRERPKLVKSIDQHAEETDALYSLVIGERNLR